MPKIHAMMDMAKRSMQNSQTALQTVSHNIANKTTEGYSRQRVDTVTAVPITEGRLQMGMGARAASVSRTNNPFLEKQLQKETGQLGFLNGQSEALARVEQVFNEQLNKGLNQYVSDFFNAFRELSNSPESITTRTLVKESAEAMTRDFSRVDRQLESIQKDIDTQIRSRVDEINKITTEISTLNQQVMETEMKGIPANDQRDRRDVLIKQLHDKIDVRVAEGDRGSVTISTAGNALLVSGNESLKLDVSQDPDTERVMIYAVPNGQTPFNITDRIKGGTLGGILQVRDHTIEDLRTKVDELAFTLADEVNQAHAEGYDRTGQAAGLFFKPLHEARGASKQFAVASDIVNDVSRIGAAAKPNAAGDASIANVISMVQYKEIFDDGTATADDFYNAQVGRVGVITQTSNKSRESQGNIVQQTSALRESISGVSLDEEATKMLEFQKTFDASARLIRTADEMFDTVLNLKRL